MGALLSLALTAVVALALLGYGELLARLLKLRFEGAFERVTVLLGLGTGLVSALVFWAGMARLLVTTTFLLLLLPSAAYGGVVVLRAFRRRTGDAVPAPRASRWAAPGLWLLLGVCAAANVLGALAPPTFADALIYHLFVPAQLLERQALFEIPAVWQHYSPMGVEMLYTAGYAVGGAKVAALLGAGLGLLTAATTALLARRLAGALPGLLAAAIFYCTAIIAWESTSCFVELGVAALGTLALYGLMRWQASGERGWFVAAALLAGFASACKLNGAFFIIVGCGLVATVSYRAGNRRQQVVLDVILFGAIASLPVVPYSLRSLVLTGNPVYPFVTSLFGENPDRAEISWVFKQYGVGYSFLDRLLSPWNLLTRGSAFENGQHLNPLPLLMAPVIVYRAWGDGQRRLLLIVTTVLFAMWAAGAHVARYLLPVQPLACVLAADVLCWLAGFGGRRRVMAALATALFLLVGTAGTLLYDKQFVNVVTGRESERAYLQRLAWYYDQFEEVCAGLPPGGRVLTNAQQPTFYLSCPHARTRHSDFDDPERLRRIIRDGGFTHVLLLANEDLVEKAARLAPDLRRLWQRRVDIAMSRTFGKRKSVPVTLFEVTGR